MSTAVIGVPEFKARSGQIVRLLANGDVAFDHANGYLAASVVFDAEEFFQAKRDADLGRWRWPENPDYVVYAPVDFTHYVRVVDERGAFLEVIHRERLEGRGSLMAQAARAYFEAHPEPTLPEENGVYVPASVDLASGPLTFVLYGGSWSATPCSDDAAELAREWHTRVGLVRLGKTEVAS